MSSNLGFLTPPYIFLLLLCGRHICKPYGDGDDAHQFRTANERTSKTAFLRSDGCESDVDVASLLIFITFPHTNRENQETRCEPPTSPLSHLICNAPSLQDHLFAGGNATQSAGQQLWTISLSDRLQAHIWRMKRGQHSRKPHHRGLCKEEMKLVLRLRQFSG